MIKNYTLHFTYRTTIVIILLFLNISVFSQQVVKHPSVLKDTNSRTETKADKRGKLVPRVALTGISDNTSIKGTSTNLMIYNTSTTGSGKSRIYPGFYHNVGTTEKPDWQRVEVSVSNAVQNK